jgi:hypothetical protein
MAILIPVLASTAHAADDNRSSGLQCGVNLGGKYVAYKPDAEPNTKKDSRFNHIAGAVRAEPARFVTAAETAALSANSSTVEVRLPRKLTLATIGCSWL